MAWKAWVGVAMCFLVRLRTWCVPLFNFVPVLPSVSHGWWMNSWARRPAARQIWTTQSNMNLALLENIWKLISKPRKNGYMVIWFIWYYSISNKNLTPKAIRIFGPGISLSPFWPFWLQRHGGTGAPWRLLRVFAPHPTAHTLRAPLVSPLPATAEAAAVPLLPPLGWYQLVI